MIKMQTTFHGESRAQRSIWHALFNENGAFCVRARANKMERQHVAKKKKKKRRKYGLATNEAGCEIFT